MEKFLAMHIAAQLTDAACGGAANQPVSPDLADNQVRARNLQVWETLRVFYRGVTGALQDSTSWPAPRIDGGQLLPSLLQSLTPLISSGPVSDILKKLLSALPAPSAIPAGPIPDPGVKT